MKASDWINIALTAAIAFAAIMQWRVTAKLEAIEAGREKVRLLLRFTHADKAGPVLSLRLANLSSIGVFIERVECSIVAKLMEENLPAIDPNQREFKRTARWIWREVLPAFNVVPFDIHDEILTAIDGRNAAFHCDLEAIAVYIDHGEERTTPPERITAVIQQHFLTQLANRGFEISAP